MINTVKTALLIVIVGSTIFSCNTKSFDAEDFSTYYEPLDVNFWPRYTPAKTTFRIWAPTAQEVMLHLYEKGDGGEPLRSLSMRKREKGVWQLEILEDLNGVYYTFEVRTKSGKLEETPGIYAKAVGVNGQRAMVLDMKSTNPRGWETDRGPDISKQNEAIIYEVHIRDFTIAPNSGSNNKGKYLGMIQPHTKNAEGKATGIDHLKELGVTHIHLLPTYDHRSIDETKLDSPQFNWGYDPLNYNVPEGSFSSDPYRAEVRIKEFKQMVKGMHDAGLGVILDVVYNHTGLTHDSYFNREAPGYYYRQRADGSFSDASACGNETASERAMMRKYMIESCKYWMEEYHLDGFRFDLMGIHDIETMNQLSSALKKINPDVIIYGEGWTAGESPLPQQQQALKVNTKELEHIAAFSDDLRDGLKGSVFIDESKGFVSGEKGMESSIKFGVVGSIQHSQIDYKKVNYSNAPWARAPWQTVSYVSCHDNHTVYDKLKISRPDASEEEIMKMALLTNAIVLTTQGISFIHAGAEMLRTKFGEHNSYNLPDSINQMDWSRKSQYPQVFNYYKNLIALRKAHPGFYMPTANMVDRHLKFGRVEDGLVSFVMSGNANGDRWKNIQVIYNAQTEALDFELDGQWTIAAEGMQIDQNGLRSVEGSVQVPAISMMMLFQE